jgi:hypothetical protein
MSKNSYFSKAQIYLTTCTHPDFEYVKYIGLDTKCDDNYLGSSAVLKWLIKRVGRSYFKKEILKTVSGSMSELCNVEQSYILSHDAVRDPDYLNLNGGRQVLSVEEMLIDLQWSILPTHKLSKQLIGDVSKSVCKRLKPFTYTKSLLLSRILCMSLYGLLKYNQASFEYSQYCNYGSSKPEHVQEVLSVLAAEGILDSGTDLITITTEFQQNLPEDLSHDHFSVVSIYN